MKTTIWKRILPFFMSLVMLFSVFAGVIPASAMEISSQPIADETPDTTGEEFYYKIIFENGVLRIQLNPQKVYEMLRDRTFSREELLKFIPEDVLTTLEKGRNISIDDLKALVSNYLSPSDLDALKELIPIEVIQDYFDLSMLQDIITVDEILSVISIDDLLNNVNEDAIAALITPEVLELLLANEQAKNGVLTDDFVEDLLNTDGFLDEILNTPGLKAELVKLVDKAIVDKILTDYPNVKDTVLNEIDSTELAAIFDSEEGLEALKSYFTKNKAEVSAFLTNKTVINKIKDIQAIRDAMLQEDVIDQLIDEKVITKDNVRQILSDDQLKSLIDASVVEALLGSTDFVNSIIGNETLLKKIATDALLQELLDEGVFDGRIEPEDVFPATMDWALFANKFSISAEDFADKFGLTTNYIYETYGTDVTVSDIINGENITSAQILEKYPNVTVSALIENGFIAVNDLYDPDVIRSVLNESEDGRRIIAASINQNTNLSFNDYWAYIDFAQLVTAIGTEAIFNVVNSDATIYPKLIDLVADSGKLTTVLDEDLCLTILQNNASAILDAFTVDELLEYFDRDAIIDEIVTAFGGYYAFIDQGYVSEETVINAIGGYATLINYLPMETVVDKVIEIVGYDGLLKFVNFNDIVASAGGYDKILSWYSPEELQAIFNAIGTDKLKTILTDSGILKNIDVKQITKDILNIIREKGTYKAFLNNILDSFLVILNTEVSSIHINGTQIYRPGRFDFEAIFVSILQAIPDVDTFLAMKEGDALAQWILRMNVRGKEYSLGISTEFIGDFTQLQDLLSEHGDSFRFDVSDDLDIAISTVLPSVTAEIYQKVLLSDRVPTTLKQKILTAPQSMQISDASDFLLSFSDDELQNIVDAVSEKTDAIRDKIYAKLDAVLGQNASKLESAKLKADQMLDAFQSVNALKKARNTALALLNRIPASLANQTIADLYEGNSRFHYNEEFSVDFYGRVAGLVEKLGIPAETAENMLLYFGNEMLLDGSFDLKVTTTGIYQLIVQDDDGNIHRFYLPAGLPLATLNKILPSLKVTFEEGAVMPAKDTTIADEELWYSIEFYLDDELFATVNYLKGTAALNPSRIPEIPDKAGYITPEWPSFQLNEQEVTRVYAYYTPKPYKITIFLPDLGINFDLHFDIEDRELTLPIPSLHGYVFDTWYIDVNMDGVINEGDVRLEPIPEAQTFRMLRATTLPEGRFALPEDYTLPADGNLALIPKLDVAHYTITFYDWDGNLIPTEELTYTIFDFDKAAITAMFPILSREHYHLAWFVGDTAWEDYDLSVGGDIQIKAKATPVAYKIIFTDGEKVLDDTLTYTVENQTIPAIQFPDRAGYTGAWYVVSVNGTPMTPVMLSSYNPANGGDLLVQSIYTPIEYTIIFHGETDITLYFNIRDQKLYNANNQIVDAPTVPEKAGYTGEWGEYDLSKPENQEVNPEYTPITYKITFHGETDIVLFFNIKDQKLCDAAGQEVPVPTVPTKDGYTSKWGAYDLTKPADQEVSPEYTPITYKITFHAATDIVLFFNIKDQKLCDAAGQEVSAPAVPTKNGYTSAWGTYDLTKPEDQEVSPVYNEITYTIYFIVGNSVHTTLQYTITTPPTSFPNVPDRTAEGYENGAWYVVKANGASINATKPTDFFVAGVTYGDIEIEARYTPIEYTAYFRVDGEVIGSVKFTVEDTELTGIPEIPAKRGYSAEWSDYEIGPADLYIDAVYTLIKYTATFQNEDGETIATINFTINDKTLANIPNVPNKAGFRGAWYVTSENGTEIDPVLLDEYTLTDANITVEPVYTALAAGDEDSDGTASTPTDDDDTTGGMSWLWWIVLVLLLIVIILAVLWFLKKKNLPPFKPQDTPPAIIAAAVPEEEEAEEEVVEEVEEKTEEINVVESIDVQTADETMTDDAAMAVVETVEVTEKALGQRAIVNLQAINDAFEDGDTVDLASLKAKKLIPAKADRVKVLASGKMDKSLTVVADAFSVQAIKMITLTGGHAIQKKYKV